MNPEPRPAPPDMVHPVHLVGRDRRLAAARQFTSPVDAVLTAVVRVWQAPPYNLHLTDQIGPHPIDGGALVFRVPRHMHRVDGTGHGAFGYYLRAFGIDRLNLTMRRSGDDAIECTVDADLTADHERDRRWSVARAALFAALGAALGAWAGDSAAGWSLALTTLLGAALAAGLGHRLHRTMMRHSLGRTRELFAGMLADVDTDLRASELLWNLPPPRALRPFRRSASS